MVARASTLLDDSLPGPLSVVNWMFRGLYEQLLVCEDARVK
jgi:hypothetical protein